MSEDRHADAGRSRAPVSEILAGLQGAVAPVKTSAAYRVGIVLVALLMVLLPVAYLGLVLLVLAATCAWAYVGGDLLFGSSRHGGPGDLRIFIVYLVPIAVGLFTCLFLFKPLIPRRSKEKPFRLSREREPSVFDFVERVARAVGAPTPREIELTMDVNAAARFRRGLLSFFGTDLVLVIGLPLVAGMNARQVAGVLAHEFGHFTQGAAMRFGYLIRSVNLWLARGVYEKDSWDQALIRWGGSGFLTVKLFSWLARGSVWLTRRVLWVFMHVGAAMSRFLDRQMEYDADRYEARVAGRDQFAETFHRLAALEAAAQAAHRDLGESWDDRQLVDDFPQLVLHEAGRMPAEVAAQIEKNLTETRTRLFDTHPSYNDRVRSVADEAEDGLFRVARPFSDLFADFPGVCRAATFDYYRGLLGERVSPKNLVPFARVRTEQAAAEEESKAFRRFWQNALTIRSLVAPNAECFQPADDPAALVAGLQAGRERLLALRPQVRAASGQYAQADGQLVESRQAEALLEAGFTLKGIVFKSGINDRPSLERVSVEGRRGLDGVASAVGPFLAEATGRLSLALRLLFSGGPVSTLEDREVIRDEAAAIVAALRALAVAQDDLTALRDQFLALELLMKLLKPNEARQKLINTILVRAGQARTHIAALHKKLAEVEYPFEHAEGKVTVAAYAISRIPTDPNDVGGVMEVADSAPDRLYKLYYRGMARLAAIAERVEQAAGLAPLPMPDEEADGA